MLYSEAASTPFEDWKGKTCEYFMTSGDHLISPMISNGLNVMAELNNGSNPIQLQKSLAALHFSLKQFRHSENTEKISLRSLMFGVMESLHLSVSSSQSVSRLTIPMSPSPSLISEPNDETRDVSEPISIDNQIPMSPSHSFISEPNDQTRNSSESIPIDNENIKGDRILKQEEILEDDLVSTISNESTQTGLNFHHLWSLEDDFLDELSDRTEAMCYETSISNEQLQDLNKVAKSFKKRRVDFQLTQVGAARAIGARYNTNVSQCVIHRFESLTLPFNGVCKYGPLIKEWLEEIDSAIESGAKPADLFKTIPPPIKPLKETRDDGFLAPLPPSKKDDRMMMTKPVSAPIESDYMGNFLVDNQKQQLEDEFKTTPRPNYHRLGEIAAMVDLDRDVVRLWFENRRKQEELRLEEERQKDKENEKKAGGGGDTGSSVVMKGDVFMEDSDGELEPVVKKTDAVVKKSKDGSVKSKDGSAGRKSKPEKVIKKVKILPVIRKARTESQKSSEKKLKKADVTPSSGKSSTPKCVLCEVRPTTAYGYTMHLHNCHQSNLISNGVYLQCSCGKEYHTRANDADHMQGKCNGQQYSLLKLTTVPTPMKRRTESLLHLEKLAKKVLLSTASKSIKKAIRTAVSKAVKKPRPNPKCVMCEKFPKTIHAYKLHLYKQHESNLKSNGIYLVCSCGTEVRSASYDPDHTSKQCDGGQFILKKIRKKKIGIKN